MTPSKYSHDDKCIMAEKIKKIDDKQKIFAILKIICKDNPNISYNSNGIRLYFHDLPDDVYDQVNVELDKYVIDDTIPEKVEHTPYHNEEFPTNNNLSPKYKLSNKEKNLIKRLMYDETINIDNDNGTVYQKFDITTDSDNANQ